MKIMVIFGGKSVEHEVSIITAYQVMARLDGHTVYPIYITKDNEMYLIKKGSASDYRGDFVKKNGKKAVFTKKGFNGIKVDVAFIAMHGTNGEDGLMASMLEFYDIPFVGSNHISAGIGQDKAFQKDILRKNNIDVVDYCILYDYQYISGDYDIELPCIIKPCLLGSSVGICVCHDNEELNEALRNAFRYDKKVLIEKYIDNFKEINCAFVGDYEYQEPSRLEEVLKTKEILDYDDKYNQKYTGSGRIIPAVLDIDVENKIIEIGKKVMSILGSSGVVRIDYIVSDKIYVNEINTIPGALAMYLFDDDFKLIDKLIKLAFKKYYHDMRRVMSYNVNILNLTCLKK